MKAEELIAEVEALGVTVLAEGGLLRLRPGSSVPPELVEELRFHKAEVLTLLTLRGWPEASRVAVRRFGKPEARLYPFLGQRVTTPQGPGRLLQVCAELACLALDNDPDRAVYLLPSEVVPLGVGAIPGTPEGSVH